MTSSGTEKHFVEFYVHELVDFIKPHQSAAGKFLKSFSIIPGRLNTTLIPPVSLKYVILSYGKMYNLLLFRIIFDILHDDL